MNKVDIKPLTESQQKLIVDNMNLVYSIAHKMMRPGYCLEDIISYGVLGFIVSLNKYDSSRGTKITTFAVMYIRLYIQQYMKKNKHLIGLENEGIIEEKKCSDFVNKIASKEELLVYLNRLSKKQQEVISLRYGLGGDRSPMTLHNVGIRLKLTKQRVYQIEHEAYNRLRDMFEGKISIEER